MITYVLGFLFSADRQKVALIKKNKPDFMNEKFNGIGGKVENGEIPKEAIIREFEEETGVRVTDWKCRGTIRDKGKSYVVLIYSAFADKVSEVKTIEIEPVSIVNISELDLLPLYSNVLYLIQAMLDDNTIEINTLTHI